jgi:hypothetical protein
MLGGHPDYQGSDAGLQPLRPAASAAVRPLAHDEFAVPAQDRVRRHNRGDVAQQSAAQAMAELGETLPLRVIETQALPFQRAPSALYSLPEGMRSPPAAHAAASRTASPPSTETETPLKSMSPRRFKLGHYACPSEQRNRIDWASRSARDL